MAKKTGKKYLHVIHLLKEKWMNQPCSSAAANYFVSKTETWQTTPYMSKNESVAQLWSTLDGRPIFNRTMSRGRNQQIFCVLRFDNAQSRRHHRSPDKLQSIREVFEFWDSYLRDSYTCGPSMTVDEQFVCFRGRCLFKQYIPSKPGKYGIKIWTICDST